MRKLETSHWKEDKALEGLLFFAQLIDEMLYDYTLDSYKPMALNSRLLCIECLETIDEVKNGYIPTKSLQSVIEELKWSLNKDLAAESIFGVKFKLYIAKLRPSEIKLNELENIIHFFYNSFEERKYLEKIIELLTSLIVDGKQKDKIKSLTSLFVSELINYGYNPNYIDYKNFLFFFNTTKSKKIETSEIINDFFKIFDFEIKEFTVVFIGGIIFRNFKNTLNSFDIAVTKTYNCFSTIPEDISFQKSRQQNESFIICSKIKAYDHHSAREKAENLIGQISGIFNFYHHKIKPEIMDKTVVCRNIDNYVVIIDKPTKPILRAKFDEHPTDAAKSVERTLSKLNLSRESTYRFARSIDLHSAALSTNALENQLLDLWAALETLLPKSMESNKDRIVQICDSLTPFLQLNYLHKQLAQLLKDMEFWNSEKTHEILNKIPGAINLTDLEKIAAFISLESTLDLRMEVYKDLSNYPLLKNRMYSLHKVFETTKSIDKLLKMHETKINWHLRRIYRVRGLIVHSGKYPSYTSILIENLHTYLDLFINKIIELSIEQKINTIEQAVLETEITLKFQLELLKKHRDEKLTLDNFKEALLGKN